MRVILYIIFFNLVSLYCFSQSSAGFFIEQGQVVPFVFNSFSKLEQGITYTNWTRIKVKMQELDPTGGSDTSALGWTLSFRALTPSIVGDAGIPANNLPLATIRLSSQDNSPNPPQFDPTGVFVELSTAFQALATTIPGFHVPNTVAAGPEQTILDISYECGGNNSGCPAAPCNQLFGKVPDLYTVDIELLLTVP